jgi:hypothetical protein
MSVRSLPLVATVIGSQELGEFGEAVAVLPAMSPTTLPSIAVGAPAAHDDRSGSV